MAFAKPDKGKPYPSGNTMPDNGFMGILGTGGIKPAG